MHPWPGIKIYASRFTFSDELLLNDLEQKMSYSKGRAESISKFLPEKHSRAHEIHFSCTLK